MALAGLEQSWRAWQRAKLAVRGDLPGSGRHLKTKETGAHGPGVGTWQEASAEGRGKL